MKTIKLLLIVFIGLISLAGSCEADPVEPETDCNCHIEGTKEISTDGGNVWRYAGTDERTGSLFPCRYDNTYTNEVVIDGVMYRTFWKCND